MKTMQGKGVGSGLPPRLRENIENPINFKPLTQDLAHGYEADVLADVAKAIVALDRDGKLSKQQHRLAVQAQILLNAFAKIGVVALIDEATGYQQYRLRRPYRLRHCSCGGGLACQFDEVLFDIVIRDVLAARLPGTHPRRAWRVGHCREFSPGEPLIALPNSAEDIIELLIGSRDNERLRFTRLRIHVLRIVCDPVPPVFLELMIQRGEHWPLWPRLKTLSNSGASGGCQIPAVEVVNQLLDLQRIHVSNAILFGFQKEGVRDP